MPLEMDSDRAICTRCGQAYGRRKGNFPVSYAKLYKGSGYIPICKTCVETMYTSYLSQCNNSKDAVRQMCRKLDLFWSDSIFDAVSKKSVPRSLMTQYIQRSNNTAYVGKCYDDTLLAEGTLWSFGQKADEPEAPVVKDEPQQATDTTPELTIDDIPPNVIEFWGPGYTPAMYNELEQRFQYYKSRMSSEVQIDMSAEALLRQAAMLEIDINRARADGRSTEKLVNSLNSVLASLQKPKKTDSADASVANTPFGVWIKRWEDERPLPEVDESLKDVDGIIKYVLTWVYGHAAHMLNIKNAHTKLYDDAIAKLRVERPEYDDEDDSVLIDSVFGGDPTDD